MPRTGPRTANGKARSSRNALKHGLSGDAPVVPGLEEVGEWDSHLQGFRDSLAPDGYVETELVTRIAAIAWRLRRVIRYETEMVVARLNEIPDHLLTAATYKKKALGIPVEETVTEDAVQDMISRFMLPEPSVLANLIRYEAHLHRQQLQLFHELEAMQARRRGESTPLARLDITGAPGG